MAASVPPILLSPKAAAARTSGMFTFVTMVVSASILLALNHLTTAETVSIAVKRVVIVSFPASFAATVVDGLSRD